MNAAAPLAFHILGPIEVIAGDAAIALGGPQQRRILAALLTEPAAVLTYARLTSVLWPDGDEPPNARRSAISYVSRLRSALGDGLITTSDAGYRLADRSWSLDANRFVALVDHARALHAASAMEVYDDALALWRGPVFGDLTDEWWARPTVSRLEELRLTALAERVDAMAGSEWDGRAVSEALALVDAHPLREPFVERAMRGLHALGQTADAVRVYHRYRNQLADQTGLEPSPALTELEAALLGGAATPMPSAGGARALRGYVLRDLIGEGAFGSVYRATQPGVEREVVVKVIRRELADDRTFIRRFEAEAQLIARIEHPHVVPLYDFWRQPGGAFLVFRFLRGGTLAELLHRHGPLPAEQAGRILDEIGGALAAAHAIGIAHRDIRPANILLDEGGASYLGDFGIAIGDPVGAVSARPTDDDIADDQAALARCVWQMLGPTGASDPAIAGVLDRATAPSRRDRHPSVAAFLAAWRSATASTDTGELALDPGPVANPYKGLRPFTEPDASDFFGRDNVVARLLDAVAATPFVAVVGPSGSGKSSIVTAGLVPALRRAGTIVVRFVPDADSTASLAAALSFVADDDAAEWLTPDRLRRDGGVAAAVAAVTHHGADPALIVIDQFEELWTVCGPDDRRRVLAGLAGVARTGTARVVATVRADSFDRPLEDPDIGELVAAGSFGVTPMSPSELHAAIVSPAARAGVRFEPGVVAAIIADATEQPGSLPLVQFTLTELFTRRSGPVVRVGDYDAVGGMAGSIGRHADELVTQMTSEDRRAVRRLFMRLVAPGEAGEYTRRRVPRSELAGVPDHVTHAFVARRLLTADRDRVTREPTVEVAHEALLRSWPLLRSWLDEERAWLRELRALAAAAAAWHAGGRDDADLYRGTRLAVVLESAAPRDAALTRLEHEFIVASRERHEADARATELRLAHERHQNRRLRRSLVAAAALLVVAVGAGAIAARQSQRADDQRRAAEAERAEAEVQRAESDRLRSVADDQSAAARTAQATAESAATAANEATADARLTTLATRSLALRTSERDLAALLAVEAYRRAPTAMSRAALFGTFTFDPDFIGYRPIEGARSAFGVAVPGTDDLLVAVIDREGRTPPLQRIDARTHEVLATFEPVVDFLAQQWDLSVSRNGRFAVQSVHEPSGRQRTFVRAFDVASGRALGPRLEIGADTTLAIDDAGDRMVVGRVHDGVAHVYDPTTGALVGMVPGLDEPAVTAPDVTVAFGPDDLLYLGSAERLRVIDAGTMLEVRRIPVPRGAASGHIEFLADGQSAIVHGLYVDERGGQHGAVANVGLADGFVRWQITGDEYGFGECAGIGLSEARDRLWCGDYFGRIRERRLSTGEKTGRVLETQNGWVESIAVVDDALMIAFGRNAGSMARWAIDANGPLRSTVAPGSSWLDVIDRDTLLTGRPNGGTPPFDIDYTVVDRATGQPVVGQPAFLFAFARDGYVGALFDDGTIGRWSPETGERTSASIDLSVLPTAVAASIDWNVVILGYADGRAVGYELATGAELFSVSVPDLGSGRWPATSMALSVDGATVYVGTGGGLHAFDTTSSEERARNVDLAGLVTIGPSGAMVVSDVDGSLTLVDPVSLDAIGTLPGARGFAQELAFDTTGATLLVSSNDNAVSLYDVASRLRLGDPIELPDDTRDFGNRVGFAPDGSFAAVLAGDQLGVAVWDLDPDRWVEAACSLAGRNLTAEEWAAYLDALGPYRTTCPE